MRRDEARRVVEQALAQVAPELDPRRSTRTSRCRPTSASTRSTSSTWWNASPVRSDSDIPESDYARVATLEGFVDYVAAAG